MARPQLGDQSQLKGDAVSDSESIEDSVMSQDGDENVNAMEESVYDEKAQ